MGRMDIVALLPVAAAVSLLATLGGRIPTATSAQTPGVAHAVGYYDSARQRPVLVGGSGQARAADRDRVWSWTGSRWQPESDSGPQARGNAGAAYDARRNLAVVTGGARKAANDSTFEIIADTWLGESTSWRRLAGSEIPATDHQALVYDDARGTVLMFGGILADRAVWPSHTWELRTEGWTRIATEGPSGRGRTALVYDSKRRQVVLFGGVGAPAGEPQTQPFFSDTWVFEHGTWRKAADGGPRGRYAHGMVYDERAGVVLLYSGAAAHRDAPLTDMWQWDGQRWTEIRLTGPTPGFRYQPVMIYDRARAKTILYGGLQGSDDATWEWDGRQWTRVEPR
jgi:hypothetical protein